MTLYTNNTAYAGIQLNSDENEKKILEWIVPLIPEGDDISAVDLTGLREQSAWAIRRPTGEVAFVSANDFLMTFDEVPGSDDEVDPLAAFEAQLNEVRNDG